MKKSQKLLEKIAAYRDLNEEERRQLEEIVSNDPQAAALLAEYQKMDEELGQLPLPVPRRAFTAEVREALENERTAGSNGGLLPMLRTLPGAALRIALVVAFIFVAAAIGNSFRQQLQLSGALDEEATATVATATMAAIMGENDALPTPIPTPTFAAEIDPQDPFRPFLDALQAGPQAMGQARGALRAGMTVYVQQAGGLATVQDAGFDSLLEQVRPSIPHGNEASWAEDAVQLVDLDGDGSQELIVALLPNVERYYEDDTGAIRVQELARPAYGEVQSSWPLAVEVADLTGDGVSEVGVTYNSVTSSEIGQQFVLVQWDGEQGLWQSTLTVPLPYVEADVAPVQIHQDQQPPAIETVCYAHGIFQGPGANEMLQRNLFQWDGDSFEWRLAQRAEATTAVQRLNVAEAYLRQGQLSAALHLYQQLSSEAGDGSDWQAIAALRVGQLLAIEGRQTEALQALAVAAEQSPAVRHLAQTFAAAYEETASAPSAWQTMVTDGASYATPDEGGALAPSPANMTALNYPGMALALAVNGMERTLIPDPAAVQAFLEQQGFTIGGVVSDDYDGDAVNELLVAYAVTGERALVSLLDEADEGWYALDLVGAGSLEDVMHMVVGHDQGEVSVLAVERRLLLWDGRHAYQLALNGYGDLSYSADPAYLCPLWAEATVEPSLNVAGWNELLLSPAPVPNASVATPTPIPQNPGTPTPYTEPFGPTAVPTENNPSVPPGMLMLTPTPTAWDTDPPLNGMTPTAPPGQ
jgi:tetratricopeptide (TPR) repeat protein